jgi:hypothetical protein
LREIAETGYFFAPSAPRILKMRRTEHRDAHLLVGTGVKSGALEWAARRSYRLRSVVEMRAMSQLQRLVYAVGLVYAVVAGSFGFVFAQSTPAQSTPAQQNRQSERPIVSPETIRHHEPRFLVRADVDHITRIYTNGEPLSVRVISEEDAYLYVIYQQADGRIYQIFPNSVERQNRVRAKEKIQVPDANDLYRWIVGPPFGKEVVKLIASKKPIQPLADPALRQGRFNPISAPRLLDTKEELGARRPAEWSEHQIEITTMPSKPEPSPNIPRRLGVFFGISH